MTTPDPVREASRRVRKYLTELGKVRGLHQEDITTFHSGDENREAALTASDLRLLCDNADAQAALSATPPQVPEPFREFFLASMEREDADASHDVKRIRASVQRLLSARFEAKGAAFPPPNTPREE